MKNLSAWLPALACGAMMLLVCVPMLLRRKKHDESHDSAPQREIAELREKVARLKAERALDSGVTDDVRS